jgi:hypothetical protein
MHTTNVAILAMAVLSGGGCGRGPQLSVNLDRVVESAVPTKYFASSSAFDHEDIAPAKGGQGRRLLVDIRCTRAESKAVMERLIQAVKQAVAEAGWVVVDEDLHPFDGQLVGFTYYAGPGRFQTTFAGQLTELTAPPYANGGRTFRLIVSFQNEG